MMVVTVILMLVSLVLYIAGFLMSNMFIITAALIFAIVSCIFASRNINEKMRTRAIRVGSVCLIVIGVVYFAVLLLSKYAVAPFIDSLM